MQFADTPQRQCGVGAARVAHQRDAILVLQPADHPRRHKRRGNSGGSPITAVEVATDAAFTAVVTTQTVSPGANGQPTVTLGHLSPATTYYWRVKTAAGDNPGVSSSSASFSIGPQLVIQAPVPVQPLTGSFRHKRPTFTVTNAVRTGPAANLVYGFEVSRDSAFSTILVSGNVPEGPSQTSFTSTSDLASGGRFYWRAQATDAATAVVSGYSATEAFATVAPDDGTFPYTFVLHIPDACVRYNSCGSVPDDVPVDGTLVVSGDRLRFSVPTLNDATFALDLARTGTQLSGPAGGVWSYRSYAYILVSKTPPIGNFFGRADRALLSGSADNDGRLSGTFDGYIAAENYAHGYLNCTASGVPWTLTLRR